MGFVPTPGPLELAIVLLVVLVIFGPKRLPDLGRSLGKGMRNFKDSITGKDDEREELTAATPDAVEPVEPVEEREPAKARADSSS
jgi:sec-independent protein translocase protein TatA